MDNDPASSSLPARDELRPGGRFWLAIGLGLVLVGVAAYLQYSRVAAARSLGQAARSDSPDPPIYGEVPPFSLVERSGRTVTLESLRGRVWVADFIFTSCTGPCPVMSRRMQDLQLELLRDRMERVLSVSFTVDPEYDTPAVLREYAAVRSADPQRWLFLTGDRRVIRDLCIHGFKLAVQDPVAGDDQIVHSTRFVLVDRGGRIRGYYRVLTAAEEADPAPALARPMDASEKRRLLRDIQNVLRENDR